MLIENYRVAQKGCLFAEKESEEFEGNNSPERKVNDVDEAIVNSCPLETNKVKTEILFF